MRRVFGLLLLSCCWPSVDAAIRFHKPHRSRNLGISTRRRLFTSPLITDPGNVDLEFSGAFDTNSDFATPTVVHYTPSGWHTEFSIGADLFDEVADRDGHLTDRINVAATTAFHAGEHFNWAIAPTTTVLLQGDTGTRLGGALFARYDRGGNTVSSSASWSGATAPSPTNPAGTFDWNGGYARRLWRRWTGYVNGQWERSSGVPWMVSLFGGVEYEVNERLSFDISGQHYNLNSGPVDHQIVAGLTWTLHQHR